MDWYQVKLIAIEATGLSRDALHILFGTSGQLLAAIVLRRTLASPIPWLCVLIAQSLNEWWDLNYEEWLDRPMWPESVQDMWVTMLVPTVLLVVVRYFPKLVLREVAEPVGEPLVDAEESEEAERTL